jgi:hypothetical protein
VLDVAKDRPHIAEQSVDRETGDEQEQSIASPRHHHVRRCRHESGRDK